MSSHRRTLAAAIAVIAASMSLYPIFLGTGWFFAGIGSTLVVAAAGTATRVRRLPWVVCAAAGVIALLLYLNLAFSNAKSLYHLLPTGASLAALYHTAGAGFTESAKYAPPVPELRGMVLLAAAGIGIAAVATDLIAVRFESAALAGLPLVLLFTEPFTLNVSRGFVGTTIAFAAGVAGYLGLLSSEGRDRIREWEQPDPDAKAAPDTRALAAAGRRVGFASIALALCLPLFIPGIHATRLFGGQPGIGGTASGGTGGVGFPDPDTQLSTELRSSANVPVLEYTTTDPTPDYLQIDVLDNLTSSGWQMFSQPETLSPVSPRLPAPPGLTTLTWASKVTTSITLGSNVGQSALDALPVPYPATSVSAPGTLRADQQTLMLFDYGTQLAGMHYTVTSIADDPPQSALESAPPPPADITSHYLEVPSSYDSLRSLARSVVGQAGAHTEFAEAVALQDWLSDGTFKYSTDAATVSDAAELTNFLKVTKTGYCQQFAFAMAVLARLLGIPSRLAYGYTSGTSLGGNAWEVTTHDAHAWPELYFNGYGWLRFEPTPAGTDGQGTAVAPAYTQSPTNPTGLNLPSSVPASQQGSTSGTSSTRLHNLLAPFSGELGGDGGTVAPAASGVPAWEVLLLVLAGLLLVAIAAPWCARLLVRRRRWLGRRAWQPDEADIAWAHAAWRELRDDLVDYSAGYRPSESPRATATRAGAHLVLADPARAALGRIALAEERARYAARPVDGTGLRTDSATVRRAIAAAVPRRDRWRGRLLPTSVLGPATAKLTAAADIFGRVNLRWPFRYQKQNS